MEFYDKTLLEGNSDELSEESLFSGLPQEVMLKLNPVKMQLVNLYLTGNYTQKRIANILGVSTTTVRAWLMNPDIQMIIKELQNRELALVQSNLNALRNKALDTMEDLLNSNMDNVRFQAAKDILDRGGLKAQQSIKVDKTVTTLEQQLADLAEFSISDEDVIDIDVSDIVEEVVGNES